MIELLHKILSFRDKRNWKRFHSGMSLSHGLMIEAGELARNFQWNRSPNIENLIDEIADCQIFLMYIAHDNGIDIKKVVEQKIAKNEIKYPVNGALEKEWGKCK